MKFFQENWNILNECKLPKYFKENIKNEKEKFLEMGGNGLVGQGIAIRIGRFLVQTPLGAQPGLETQPHYKAAGDLQVNLYKRSD